MHKITQNRIALVTLVIILIAGRIIDFGDLKIFEGITIGALSLYIFTQVSRYGTKNSFLEPQYQVIRELFNHLKEGNLREVKKIKQVTPNDTFFGFSPYGGYTALMYASQYGHIDIIKYLLKEGANVNQMSTNRETALLRACYFNRFEAVKILVENGADINHRDLQDMSPLLTAFVRGKRHIAEYLLLIGAKLDFDSENLKVQQVIRENTEDYEYLKQVVGWKKQAEYKMKFLKFHKHRDQSKHYPDELKNLQKNLFAKVFNEYM